MIHLTAPFAGVLGLLLVALSLNVVRHRRRARVSIGDGADRGLEQAIRTQANCAEYAPIGIVALALVELSDGAAWMVVTLGLMLVTGRVMHAYGFGRTPQIMILRQLGMVLTLTMLALSAIWLLIAPLI